MYYCVVYFLSGDTSKIEEFRKTHGDFTASAVGAHITLVFPVISDGFKEEDLKNHVAEIASNFRAFRAELSGFEKSWDNWLFLNVKSGQGKEEFMDLHDKLYTGILSSHLRNDLPFSPHVSLALLNKENSSYRVENPTATELDEEKYKQALKEAREADLDCEVAVDKLTLIKLDNELKETVGSFDFPLSKG